MPKSRIGPTRAGVGLKQPVTGTFCGKHELNEAKLQFEQSWLIEHTNFLRRHQTLMLLEKSLAGFPRQVNCAATIGESLLRTTKDLKDPAKIDCRALQVWPWRQRIAMRNCSPGVVPKTQEPYPDIVPERIQEICVLELAFYPNVTESKFLVIHRDPDATRGER
jgi:hypothetical protein